MTNEQTLQLTPHSAGAWVQVFRPFSYTASIIPVLLGAALTLQMQQSVQWMLLPLILIASVLLQAGTNLASEYFDYKKGVDRPETYGSSRVLVEQLLKPLHVLVVGMGCFAMTAAIGLVFIAMIGWPIFIIGIIGLTGGFFYTATPAAYKYVGLGDLFVFCLMGPLMVIGSFLVLTGGYSHDVLLISLPVGFLVAAILSGNNLRDIYHDTQAKINTAATLLGHRWARWEYMGLIITAYISTLAMVGLGVLPVWSLLTLVTAPIAMKNLKTALASRPDRPESVAMLDVQTAQLHLLFGLLLIASVLLGVWL